VFEWAGEPNKSEKHRRAMDKLRELCRYFCKRRIYLPDPLCIVVEKLIEDVRMHVVKFGTYVEMDASSRPAQGHSHMEKYEV